MSGPRAASYEELVVEFKDRVIIALDAIERVPNVRVLRVKIPVKLARWYRATQLLRDEPRTELTFDGYPVREVTHESRYGVPERAGA